MMNGRSKGIKLLVAIGILIAARTAIAQESDGVPVSPPDLESFAPEDAALGGLELSEPQHSALASINDRFNRRRAEISGRSGAAGDRGSAARSARTRLRAGYWNTLTADQRDMVRSRSRQRLLQQRANGQQRAIRFRADARVRPRPRTHRPNRPTDRNPDAVVDR